MVNDKVFGWGIDGYGNKHYTLNGVNVLFVVKRGDCFYAELLKHDREQMNNKAKIKCGCGRVLVVAERGADYIAYCAGSYGFDGCGGEFGDTKKQAIENYFKHNPIVAKPDNHNSNIKPSWIK